MAPQKLKPFDRVLLDAATANLSDDRGQQLIFDYYKRAGYLPAKDIQGRTFKSLQDYLSTVQRLVEKERLRNPSAKPAEWLKSAEARLGLNRQIRSAKTGRDLAIVASKQLEAPKQKLAKNRVGAVFPLEIGNNGKVVFNKRKYMSAEGGIPRPVYDFIASKHGTEVANTYQKTVRKEWKDMGVAAKELEAKTGIPFERGHWLANKYGGAESARAGALQIAELNRLQGDLARGDLGRLKETGRASLGWLDDFYEWDLTTNKLSVPGAENLNLADLVAISLKEVDPNAMLSRRETEAKLGTLNPDPVGFNFIGTQIDRDQSINQKAQIKADERLLGKNIGGYLPVPIPSMRDIKQNPLGMGIGAATEAITPESAYAAGKGDWRTAATEAAKSIGTGAVVGGAVQAGLTNLMPRAAAALASGPALPYVTAVSTGLALQDAAQAYRAGKAGRSIPLQQKIEQTEQGKRRQQDVAQFRAAMPGPASRNRMQANLSGKLSPQQIESFRAGGGNAAMMRDGLSVQQVIERGSSLRLRKVLESTIRKEV